MDSVVLLSGGVDSTVALARELSRFGGQVRALTVDYGQRHIREVEAAKKVAEFYSVDHTIVAVDSFLFSGSALTGGAAIPKGHAENVDGTYVPARNTVLLALASALAESIGFGKIIFGANSDDEAGYPDCRAGYIESFRDVLAKGTVGHVWLSAPLMAMSKRNVVELGRTLGVPFHLTWSCYAGGESKCGVCGACAGLVGLTDVSG